MNAISELEKDLSDVNRKDLEADPRPAASDLAPPTPEKNWTTFKIAVLTSVLLWFAFPPVGLWPLAWVATMPLAMLIQMERLPGQRPYRQLFLAGFVYWLVSFYFMPIPHWGLWFGWIVISSYLALFTLLFVGSARQMVHRFRVPLVIAVPVAWTGVEWIRSTAFTGQPMVCLSHSQFKQPWLIQISDLFGGYTLTFVMVMFASAIVASQVLPWPKTSETKNWSYIAVAISLVGATLLYGNYRLQEAVPSNGDQKLTLALIQGSVDTDLDGREEELERKFKQYCGLTIEARKKWNDLELIVWPESNLPIFDILPDADLSSLPPDEQQKIRNGMGNVWATILEPNRYGAAHLLAGTGTTDSVDIKEVYVSAIMIDRSGRVADRYFKNHLVMYGEYFPILDSMPWFKDLFVGHRIGTKPTAMDINGVTLAPNICFESAVPGLVRRHLNTLQAGGNEPDAMINITNDGWFYGTSCLDFHLACNVFRAVEMRKPNLVCANTGFSAEIDSNGRMLQLGPRRDTGIYRVEIGKHQRNSIYRKTGDWIPFSMGWICIVVMLLIPFGKTGQRNE